MKKNINILILALWFIAGILALLADDIPKLAYFLVWINLLLRYLSDVLNNK